MVKALGIALAAALLALVAPVAAQPANSQQQDALKAELKAAWDEAGKAAIMGPAEVPLNGQAKLAVPADSAFIPQAAANRVMKALGNTALPERAGLVVPRDPKAPWLVDVTWIGEGYVRDGDAADWQADAMLQSLKEGTEEQNKDRVARGIPPVEIVGWVEPPTYDKASNRLIWSLSSRTPGDAAGVPQTVNYNTYALGREGYFSLDLITGSDTIAADKQVARQLLAALRYDEGKRYADFNDSTDKVAAYGIAALVGAVAVKKLGLLALIGVFLLKAWKIALLIAVGGFAAVRRFFGGLFGRKPAAEPDEISYHEAPAEPEAATEPEVLPAPDSAGEAGPGEHTPQA